MPIVHETMSLDCGTLVYEVKGLLLSAELKERYYLCVFLLAFLSGPYVSAWLMTIWVLKTLSHFQSFLMQCLHCGG